MSPDQAAELFTGCTAAMFDSGRSLMLRVVGNERGEAESWLHHPEGDVVNGPLGARWFYHCHAPGDNNSDEHGHFHLFVSKSAFALEVEPFKPAPINPERKADVVHIAALSINTYGLPIGWFTTNRWVTDEWMYRADDILPMIGQIDFRGSDGDRLVNEWLTAIVALQIQPIKNIIVERDRRIVAQGIHSESRGTEVLSSVPLDIQKLFA